MVPHTSVLKTFHQLVYLQLSDVSITVSLKQLIVILIFKFGANDANLLRLYWFHLGREGLCIPYFIFDQGIFTNHSQIYSWIATTIVKNQLHSDFSKSKMLDCS